MDILDTSTSSVQVLDFGLRRERLSRTILDFAESWWETYSSDKVWQKTVTPLATTEETPSSASQPESWNKFIVTVYA